MLELEFYVEQNINFNFNFFKINNSLVSYILSNLISTLIFIISHSFIHRQILYVYARNFLTRLLSHRTDFVHSLEEPRHINGQPRIRERSFCFRYNKLLFSLWSLGPFRPRNPGKHKNAIKETSDVWLPPHRATFSQWCLFFWIVNLHSFIFFSGFISLRFQRNARQRALAKDQKSAARFRETLDLKTKLRKLEFIR